MCSVKLLIRVVRIAICTSGDPVSSSFCLNSSTSSRFRSFVIVIATVPAVRHSLYWHCRIHVWAAARDPAFCNSFNRMLRLSSRKYTHRTNFGNDKLSRFANAAQSCEKQLQRTKTVQNTSSLAFPGAFCSPTACYRSGHFIMVNDK